MQLRQRDLESRFGTGHRLQILHSVFLCFLAFFVASLLPRPDTGKTGSPQKTREDTKRIVVDAIAATRLGITL